jgi:hypothetical protein
LWFFHCLFIVIRSLNDSCCVLLASFRASSTPMFSIHGLFPKTTLEPLKKTQQLHRKSLTHLLPFSQKIQVAYGWHKLG